ncbi:putative acyltransferase [Thiomonas arsenitoxydans]|uniref:Acyltransferase n=1 Tax=Thiomonas arsenitoxydans (strain DSM 22701 / CIP 110005 / 3As) TaxID=426114 RepID=D6CVA2_THIA3|nr:putative acyltransferase [Thiomonas arsenitoxydans]CQR34410.1 putative acyltransferase [Thiomonas arsenitoxydans]CQR35066.1 putative acyltransferase [Thiomonas arsenitoxydans]CQR37283.1 putative acyltransferase [Thiomonas arsenitoxydans]CQR37454.1 putative acyltransferase [Thiomonas arsenitoxydans]
MTSPFPAQTPERSAEIAATASLSAAEWAQTEERSNHHILRVMTWISLRLGRRIGRVVLAGIAVYFVLFAPGARRASRQYLKRVLGRDANWADGYRHVFSFASTIHDRVYLLNDRWDLFDLRVQGADVLDAVLAQGRGAFLMGAHFGSFEVLRALARRDAAPRVSLLMYPDNARKINDALHAINPAAAQDIIPLGRLDSMLRLQDRLDAGGVVGFLADRSLHDDSTATLPFFGQPAPWPRGPLRIAALLKRPVVLMFGIYRGGNRYDVHFERLADFTSLPRSQRAVAIDIALESYVQRLEMRCTDAPYNWFNFYDFWKGPEAEAAGPTEP